MELRLHKEAKAKWDSVLPKFAVTDYSVLPNPLVLVTHVEVSSSLCFLEQKGGEGLLCEMIIITVILEI